MAENASARLIGLRSALWLVALLTVVGLFFTGMLPRRATGRCRLAEAAPSPDGLRASADGGQAPGPVAAEVRRNAVGWRTGRSQGTPAVGPITRG